MPRLVLCPRCQSPMESEKHLFDDGKWTRHDVKTLVWTCSDCGYWVEETEKTHRVLATSNDEEN